MIDIEKFICSLINRASGFSVIKVIDIIDALNNQGLDYKDGKIVPIDNKPKFKKGDWLCENEPNNYARFIQILETVNVQGKERYRISRDIHNDEDIVEFGFVEKYYHKFDIQDAKDGDVLYCKSGGIEYIVMGKGVNEHGNIDSYFRYNSLNGFGVDVPSVLSSRQDDITPAAKEQREKLFAAMHEAGYEWDAENKQLRKIGQNPAWSEEDEEMRNSIVKIFKDSQRDGISEAIMPEQFDKIFDWLKFLKDRIGCEANCTTMWKPSGEQMKYLHKYAEQNNYDGAILTGLYDDLLKAYNLNK